MRNSVSHLNPLEIRALLHAQIDRLGDEDVGVLYRIALELELGAVSMELDGFSDAARSAGRLERIENTIRSARDSIRERHRRQGGLSG